MFPLRAASEWRGWLPVLQPQESQRRATTSSQVRPLSREWFSSELLYELTAGIRPARASPCNRVAATREGDSVQLRRERERRRHNRLAWAAYPFPSTTRPGRFVRASRSSTGPTPFKPICSDRCF